MGLFLIGTVMLSWILVGYPLWVRRSGNGLELPAPAQQADPFAIVLVIRDAGPWLPRKLKELMEFRHNELKTIHVVDDGSIDNSLALLNEVQDSRIKVHQRNRLGKSAALNWIRNKIDTPVAVLMDVRQELSIEGLDLLVKRVSGESILSACSGCLVPSGGSTNHWNHESRLRRDEGLLGRTIGLSGCATSLRRSHWVLLPDDCLVDDMALGLGVLACGGLVALDPEIKVADSLDPTPSLESARKRRTLAGNWQILCQTVRYRLPQDQELRAALWHHKFIRLFLPLWSVMALVGFFGVGQMIQKIVGGCLLIILLFQPGKFIEFVRLNWAALRAAFIWKNLAQSGGWRTQGRGSK